MASLSSCTSATGGAAGTQQYPYPSHVNPSGVVSIKLSGKNTYNPWQEQMLCLIESHDMQGFINGSFKNPKDMMNGETVKLYEEWRRSDSLVKGWIFGSLTKKVMTTAAVGLPTAMDLWNKLKITYGDFNGRQPYPYPSHVQPSKFVSLKLSGQKNYYVWQEKMAKLIERHGMLGFIDGTFKKPKDMNGDSQNTEGETMKLYEEWKRSDSLVKDWIFGLLNEEVMGNVEGLPTAMDVWQKLKTSYSTHNKGTQQYPYATHVQPNDFVSIVLCGEINFHQWQKQMMRLIESHGMLDFITRGVSPTQDITKFEEWRRRDTLVKEWIIGSLSEDIKAEVVDHSTAYDVWNYLYLTYHDLTINDDKGLAKHMPLHRAIMQRDWATIQQRFNMDNNVLAVKLNRWYQTPLHVAIARNADISLLGNLLNNTNPESLPSMVDIYGYTPLHSAAFMGNHDVAKMLVEKSPELLFVSDQLENLPLNLAASRPQSKTFRYLLDASKRNISLSGSNGYHSPFEGTSGALLLQAVIDEGVLDVAYELIKEYPDLTRIKVVYGDTEDIGTSLKWMVDKSNLYYSGTQYNFYQRFIYTHVPIDNIVGDTHHVQDIENQETFVSCCRSYFRTVIKRIYVKIWEITLLHVSHVKHLKEDKLKHKNALILLKRICGEVGKMLSYIEIEGDVYMATNVATRNNISGAAIKEIIMHFPQAYDLTHHPTEYNMIQLAIKNRSENVYNLLVHDLSIMNLINVHRLDEDGNNLLHLAGGLPPIHKLSVVSGAALQMQRELQWFKEVEKFVERKQKEAKNNKQETPFMMFRREHSGLRKEGEEWMKKTADSYTITTALIITIVFAAAITVPGGNNNTGESFYATKTIFKIFAIADAISLFTSTTSLLLFLSILTARYCDEDFLYKLPKRLILGLLTLFLSVTSLMVAFSAALYLTFGQQKVWILAPIAALTCLSITSFVMLQFPLLVELISSTYGSGIFGKNK